jgi:hypothetical protein
MLLLVKDSLLKKEVRVGTCPDATASSFVPKVRVEAFAHFDTVAANHHSSMWK